MTVQWRQIDVPRHKLHNGTIIISVGDFRSNSTEGRATEDSHSFFICVIIYYLCFLT